MPSQPGAQKRTMAAIAHGWKPDNPEIAKIPVKAAKEFNKADQRVAGLKRRGLVSNKAWRKVTSRGRS